MIRKVHPDDTSILSHRREFEFHFQDYVRLDSIVPYFENLSNSIPYFYWYVWYPTHPFSPENFAKIAEDVNPEFIKVFPNPVSDYFYISSSATGFETPNLFDEIGKKIFDLNAVQLTPQLWCVDMQH